MIDGKTPPQYHVATVEAVILQVAAELHPQRLTAKELSLRIVSDTEDTREVETAAQAIRGLSEYGLFRHGGGGIVMLTPAGRHAVALLT